MTRCVAAEVFTGAFVIILSLCVMYLGPVEVIAVPIAFTTIVLPMMDYELIKEVIG